LVSAGAATLLFISFGLLLGRLQRSKVWQTARV
jgi:hypothetical protein